MSGARDGSIRVRAGIPWRIASGCLTVSFTPYVAPVCSQVWSMRDGAHRYCITCAGRACHPCGTVACLDFDSETALNFRNRLCVSGDTRRTSTRCSSTEGSSSPAERTTSSSCTTSAAPTPHRRRQGAKWRDAVTAGGSNGRTKGTVGRGASAAAVPLLLQPQFRRSRADDVDAGTGSFGRASNLE